MKFLMLLVLLPVTGMAEILKCPCQVDGVTNGDTVFVLDQHKSSRKIWLAGIDAPEMNQFYGVKSRQNLINLVSEGNISVVYTQRDRYGRIVGKLLKGGRDINLQQIKDGFAWHYKKNPDELSAVDRARYSQAETEARKKKLGLWSINAVPPWDFRKNN